MFRRIGVVLLLVVLLTPCVRSLADADPLGQLVILQNDNDTPRGVGHALPGYKFGAVLTPLGWHYPCKIREVTFRFYRAADAAPVTNVRVEIYAMVDGRPGALLGASNYLAYTTSNSWVTVDMTGANIILHQPDSFLATVAYSEAQSGEQIAVVVDSANDVPENLNFIWRDGAWYEHYDYWYGPRTVGNLMIRAKIETGVVAPHTATPTATRASTRTPTATATATSPTPPTATRTATTASAGPSLVHLPVVLKPPRPAPTATPTATSTATLAADPCNGLPVTPFFSLFFGTIRIDGADSPAGTVVELYSPRGNRVGCMTTTSPGVYPYTYAYGEDASASPPISGMRAGETVTFKVDGVTAATNPASVTWQDDKATHQVDLVVSTGVETSTPTSTVPAEPTDSPSATATHTLALTSTSTPSQTPTSSATPTTPPSSWTTIVAETFEGAFPGPWNVFDDDGWTSGQYFWGKRDCQAFEGSYSGWAVGGGGSGAPLACGSDYPSNANSWMVFGPFSLEGATAAEMTARIWRNTDNVVNDGIAMSASIDGQRFSGYLIGGPSETWLSTSVDLSDMGGDVDNLLGQSSVWVALIFKTDASGTKAQGVYADNVVVRKCMSGTCEGGSSASMGTAVEQPTYISGSWTSTR